MEDHLFVPHVTFTKRDACDKKVGDDPVSRPRLCGRPRSQHPMCECGGRHPQTSIGEHCHCTRPMDDREDPHPICGRWTWKNVRQSSPPVDNEHVAPGCEPFDAATVALNRVPKVGHDAADHDGCDAATCDFRALVERVFPPGRTDPAFDVGAWLRPK